MATRVQLAAGLDAGTDPVVLAKSVLCDHANAPQSICAPQPSPALPQSSPCAAQVSGAHAPPSIAPHLPDPAPPQVSPEAHAPHVARPPQPSLA